MRRLLVALSALSVLGVGVAASTQAAYTPVCLTVPPGVGWNWVATQFAPTVTGDARSAFIGRIWGYEEEARLTAGELVCIDPNDPALAPATSTTLATTTTASPSTTTTTVVASTTVPATSTTTVSSPTSTSLPPTGNGPLPSVPSNFNTGQYLQPRAIDVSTANEPSGNFRTLCRPSHYAHDDPIVNPGTNSAHLHLFFGNTAANRNSDYNSLRTTGNSTCEGGPINRTGYWMPAVFDGQGRVVPPDLIIVYYKATASGGTLAQQQAAIRAVQPLPNGLRMVSPVGQHMSWYCGDSTQQGPTIPADCPTDYLIASVSFPDCWNGRDLDSPDHRSHMAYRFYNSNGVYVCPLTHPVQIPSITEGFHWQQGATDINTWSLSSDMGAPRGSTMHADWFGAWDNPVQDRWFQNCLIGMRNSNNGNLCDGQGLTGWSYSGAVRSSARLPGFTPMS